MRGQDTDDEVDVRAGRRQCGSGHGGSIYPAASAGSGRAARVRPREDVTTSRAGAGGRGRPGRRRVDGAVVDEVVVHALERVANSARRIVGVTTIRRRTLLPARSTSPIVGHGPRWEPRGSNPRPPA